MYSFHKASTLSMLYASLWTSSNLIFNSIDSPRVCVLHMIFFILIEACLVLRRLAGCASAPPNGSAGRQASAGSSFSGAFLRAACEGFLRFNIVMCNMRDPMQVLSVCFARVGSLPLPVAVPRGPSCIGFFIRGCCDDIKAVVFWYRVACSLTEKGDMGKNWFYSTTILHACQMMMVYVVGPGLGEHCHIPCQPQKLWYPAGLVAIVPETASNGRLWEALLAHASHIVLGRFRASPTRPLRWHGSWFKIVFVPGSATLSCEPSGYSTEKSLCHVTCNLFQVLMTSLDLIRLTVTLF